MPTLVPHGHISAILCTIYALVDPPEDNIWPPCPIDDDTSPHGDASPLYPANISSLCRL